MEKISVIIPTYNREKTILRALQSVLGQTYTNLEVLVVDDGSTDATVDIVKGVGDNRVQYISLGKNGGTANARNEGARRASGEWIAFQDSDDCWCKDKLEKQMRYAEAHPEFSMIYGKYRAHLLSGEELIVPGEPLPQILEGRMLKTLLERNVIGTPTMLVRKQEFLSVGAFCTNYSALEDWEYVIRFAGKYQIGFVPEVLMDAYLLSGGVSSNVAAYYESRCKMLAQYKAEMIQEGVLEAVMEDILNRAQGSGILQPIKKMMMLYLCK